MKRDLLTYFDIHTGISSFIPGIISLVGNGCVLLIFSLRYRRLSPVEVFLVNLGIVDILLAAVSYPFAMISSFRHRWDFGELGKFCKAHLAIKF